MKFKKIMMVMIVALCFTGCAKSGEDVNTRLEQEKDKEPIETDKENESAEKDTILEDKVVAVPNEGTVEDVKYEITKHNNSDATLREKYSKRGYWLDTENRPGAPYYINICSGQKGSGGCDIDVVDIKIDKENNIEMIVREKAPGVGEVAASVITYPNVVVTVHTSPNTIVVKTMEGEEFAEIKR